MNKKKFIFMIVIVFGLIFMSACQFNESDSDADRDSNEEIEDTDEHQNEVDDEVDGEVEDEPEIVLENEAFRIYEPAPDSEVDNEFTVRGQARVSEANVQYEFEDGHFILDKGYVTASEAAPAWGDFEITIRFDEMTSDHGHIVLYEENVEDGSRLHELMIPVKRKE